MCNKRWGAVTGRSPPHESIRRAHAAQMRSFSAARLVGLLFVVATALAGDESTMDALSAALGLATRALILPFLRPPSHASPKEWPPPFLSNYASWSGVTAGPTAAGLTVTGISLKGLNLKVLLPASQFDLLTNLISLYVRPSCTSFESHQTPGSSSISCR